MLVVAVLAEPAGEGEAGNDSMIHLSIMNVSSRICMQQPTVLHSYQYLSVAI